MVEIPKEEKKCLNIQKITLITQEKIIEAVDQIKLGKTPGKDEETIKYMR